jgi:hypothetical protein
MDGIVCVVLLYEGTALCCILQLSLSYSCPQFVVFAVRERPEP